MSWPLSPHTRHLPAGFSAKPRAAAPACGLLGRMRAGMIIGRSRAVSDLLAAVDRIGQSDASVLLLGESGTGKELFARAIHARSTRARAPFLAVNCGAVARAVAESELFGHVRGAFTGAIADRPGLFAAAHGGTLLLDEIGELAL